MELTFVVAVKDIWQLQPSWLQHCQVCDQGRSVGKIKFTRNRKMVGSWGSPPPPDFFLKKCWKCWEKNEIKDAKRRILTLFESMFWKLELLRKFWKRGRLMVHSAAIWNHVLEVGTAKKCFKTRSLNCAFFAIYIDVLEVWTAE